MTTASTAGDTSPDLGGRRLDNVDSYLSLVPDPSGAWSVRVSKSALENDSTRAKFLEELTELHRVVIGINPGDGPGSARPIILDLTGLNVFSGDPDQSVRAGLLGFVASTHSTALVSDSERLFKYLNTPLPGKVFHSQQDALSSFLDPNPLGGEVFTGPSLARVRADFSEAIKLRLQSKTSHSVPIEPNQRGPFFRSFSYEGLRIATCLPQRIGGRLETLSRFEQELAKERNLAENGLILDLSLMGRVSKEAFGKIIECYLDCRDRGLRFVIVCNQPSKVFNRFNLLIRNSVFPIVSSVEEAIDGL